MIKAINNLFSAVILNKIWGVFYTIFIISLLILMTAFVIYIAKEGFYDYAFNRYNYKIKTIIRDDCLFIYFTPFIVYPKVINYNRIRQIGASMAKEKAPKSYKKLNHVFTVNRNNLTIYKEPSIINNKMAKG